MLKKRFKCKSKSEGLSVIVYKLLRTIPKGQVISYKELAKRAGAPAAVRYIATLVGQNPHPIVVPCHRVIRSNGELGNYTWQKRCNPMQKLQILESEGVLFKRISKVRQGKPESVYILSKAPKGAIL